MQYSTNLNMNKPERSDQYNIDHWNDNTDILDTQIQNIKELNDATLKASLLNFCYPIGSLYWSSQSTNPHDLFGGTWTQIKDRFVWAKGDSDTVNATGGAKTVTLTVENLPSHNHTFTGTAHTHTISGSTGGESSHTHNINGGGTASSNEPSTLTAWFHGKSVTSGAGSAHKHTISGSTGGESSHTHSGTTLTFTGTAINNTSNGSVLLGLGSTEGTGNIRTPYKSYSKVGGTTADISTYNLKFVYTPEGSITGSTGSGTSHSHGAGTLKNSDESAHTHSVTASGWINGKTNAGSSHSHGAGTLTNASTTATGTIGNTGSGTAVNKMPPYVVKYCWERTA